MPFEAEHPAEQAEKYVWDVSSLHTGLKLPVMEKNILKDEPMGNDPKLMVFTQPRCNFFEEV